MHLRFSGTSRRLWFVAAVVMVLTTVVIMGVVYVSPRWSRAQTPGPVGSDVQPISGTSATEAYTPTGLTAEQVMAAFNCARQRASLPAYKRTVMLDAEASRLLQQIQRDTQFHLHPGDGGYALTSQLLLNANAPAQECQIGGFDVAKNLPDLDKANTIGIAMRPLSNPYRQPLFQVMVVGR